MSRFVQLHLLTSYPPANLNRDDLGRPKTAIMGGAQRLRISSQSLKRAWRTSDIFQQALDGHIGVRTKEMGRQVFKILRAKSIKEKDALKWASEISSVFGTLRGNLSDKDKKNIISKLEEKKKTPEEIDLELKLLPLDLKQLAHFTPEERKSIDGLCQVISERGSGPDKDELGLLKKQHSAADIALFGRMLANTPGTNTDAAAQVAHALSVHKVTVEDDFFTAVDDLNTGEEDVGAGHMGETEFAAGLFYQYICIDRDLLKENLGGDEVLTNKTLAALAEAAATVAPSGKQNSFASRARASYILAETGDQQPRSLSVAFLKPVNGIDMLSESVTALDKSVSNMDKAYGECADSRYIMNLSTGEGSLKEIIDGITE